MLTQQQAILGRTNVKAEGGGGDAGELGASVRFPLSQSADTVAQSNAVKQPCAAVV